MVRFFLGPSSSIKNTDCQVPKSNPAFLMGKVSDDESKNDFKCDLALSSILSCRYEYLSVIKLSKVNSKSLSSPGSFSLTTMADVECYEKTVTMPSSTSINSLIFEVMSMISNFLSVSIFKE